ncbi:hypothetical protein GGR95_002794 [Sulfitobacter undariae]|uniref:Antifreeze protein n=1 Tax=Sulfitobacter undariae TaxID=1563671 RepID=A0A7W6EBH1_9RHOB|nr:antifreeze protein [Sulfitobacter undariae]MBB3995143.1 hypothetical protein [Sulfitobacter undariae]
MKTPDPFGYFNNAVQMAHIMVEAQSVIGMRMMGMAGLWSVPKGEDETMVAEKLQAMTRASADATALMLRGGTPDQITAAALKPYRQKTRANAKRLGKRGLKTS